MSLFAPAWQGKNEKRALAFVQKEQDFLTLCEIAEKAPLPQVRSFAVSRIKDLDRLLRLYRLEKDPAVSQELKNRLHNQSGLVSLILDAVKSEDIKREALVHIDDEELIIQIVSFSKDTTIAELAAQKLRSRPALVKAAKINVSAAERLTEISDIFSALVETNNNDAAKVLMEKISNPHMFFMLAQKARLAGVRRCSAEQVSNDKEMMTLLLHTHDSDVASVLLPGLEDQDRLIVLAGQAEYEPVQVAAASRISDEKVVGKLIIDNPCRFMPLLEKIENGDTLQWIEQNTCNESLLAKIHSRQGVYICTNCGGKSPSDSCVCQLCGAENHDLKPKSNIREYRDYATGTEWDECTRCGKKINERSVYHEYLE